MEHVSVKFGCPNMQRYYQINLILLRGKSQGSFWHHILTVVISASFFLCLATLTFVCVII